MADNPRIDELKRKLAAEPGSRLFSQLAEELRKAGQLEEAIRIAHDGLQKHPNYPSARMTLGRALHDAGQFQEARAEYEAVLKGAPDNILAGRLLAECLEALGDPGAALSRYRTTLLLAPGEKTILSRIHEIDIKLKGGGEAAPVATEKPAPAAPPVPPRRVERAEMKPAPPREELEPPPIPLVAVEEDSFELERAVEAPTLTAAVQSEVQAVERASSYRAPTPPVVGVAETGVSGGKVEAETLGRFEEFDFEAEAKAETSEEPRTIPWRLAGETAAKDQVAVSAPVDDLASATLGELYYGQGLMANAIDVYRKLVAREPTNERARARLAELEAAGRPERRRVIERAISRLGSFLVAVKSAKVE